MSSCQRFVQNAWKKELCSNCFKSKDEHISAVDNRLRYLTALKNQSSKPPPPSILKGVKIKKTESRKVNFPREESEIIGFGGDDYSDDENEEICLQESQGVEEDVVEEDDEKELQRITKSNTDFNSNPANLIENDHTSEVKKPIYTPLMLGKPVKDADGKKQTLFVSVQPFGTGSQTNTVAVNRKTHLRSLLHDSLDMHKIKELDPIPINSSTDKSASVLYRVKDVDSFKTSKQISCSDLSNIDSSSPVELPLLNGNESNILKPTKEEQFVIIESNDKTDTGEKVEHEIIKTDLYFTAIKEEKSHILKGSVYSNSCEELKTNHSTFEPDSKNFELQKKFVHTNVNILNEEKNVIEQKNIKNISNGVCDKKNTTKTHFYSKSNDTFSKKSLSKLSSVNCTCNGCIMAQDDIELDQSKNILCLLETGNIQVKSQCSETEVNCVNFVMKNIDNEVPITTDSEEKDMSFHLLKLLDPLAESREMAGEPDGRADSDDLDEPPGLPSSPLPTLPCEAHPQSSFLHNLTKDKPKIPLKPKLGNSASVTEEIGKCEEMKELRTPSPTLPSGLPSSSELNGKSIKRQAPKPPPLPNDDGPGVFIRNLGNQNNMDSPVVRERVKRVQRERAASCSPLPSDSSSNSSGHHTPEPSSPRHSISVSHETLSHEKNTAVTDKKRGNKMRSTIRKFLRLGSRDDHVSDELPSPPLPPVRPRPEIIHPLDLNKSGVEVVRGSGSHVLNERASIYSPSSPPAIVSPTGRPSKPPPPPRSQSLDLILDTRPARPPPPKVEHIPDQRQIHTTIKTDGVYANIGEARSSIAPVKPQRTASIRDSVHMEGGTNNTTDFHQALELQAGNDNDNVYEYLAPECDLSRERSSLPYCGSETESDIYYPYTFGSNQELLEDEPDTSTVGKNKLYVQKGCNMICKSIEENYSAIVAANYETLTQLLEQVHQTPILTSSLRALKATTSLQWSDFDVSEDSSSVVFAGRVFLNARWNQVPVTLCLTLGQSRLPHMLSPLAQFFDLIASKYLNSEKTELVQVSVTVLVKQQVYSLSLYCTLLKDSVEAARESVLIMVQVINNLKSLQARGIEDTHLTQFIVSREEKDFSPKVYHLPQENEKKNSEGMSLCQCAVTTVAILPLPKTLSMLLRTLLSQERATSLSQSKAVLELWLWGPTTASVTSDVQGCLQRWLDFERATVLNTFAINHQSRMSVSEYCRLSFLVGTNAKIMAEAFTLLESTNASATTC